MQKKELKTWFVILAIIVSFLVALAMTPTPHAIVVIVKRVGLAILTLSVLYRAYVCSKQRPKQNAAAQDA